MKKLTINIPGDRDKLYTVIHYPAGEIQVRLTPEGIFACTGKDQYIIAANPIPDLMELAMLKDALDNVAGVRWFNRKLELMYLPYARADRRFVPGDTFGLQVFAALINSLHFNTVYTFDVHSDEAHKLIGGLVSLDPIHSYDQLTDCIKHMDGKLTDFALIAPDAGARHRYDLDVYGFSVLLAGKTRDAATGKLSGFTIEPAIKSYKKALIVDDICDGGGTFIGLGKEIKKLNPDIMLGLYVSHGIFSQGTDALHEVFDNLYISDYSYIGEHNSEFKAPEFNAPEEKA